MKKVTVHLFSQSAPIEYTDVRNAYTKDDLYCIRVDSETVHKYPFRNIFRITESYNN